MFGAWANGIAFLPYGFLQARGKPHVTAKVGIAEIVPFFLVLWFLTTRLGLPGAALAWTLRVTANCIVLHLLSGCIPDRTLARTAGGFTHGRFFAHRQAGSDVHGRDL